MNSIGVNYTHLPAISEATLPNTVVVAVAALRTSLPNLLKSRFASIDDLCAWPLFRVSERPGISEECLYSVTRAFTANFWLSILSTSCSVKHCII